MKRFSLLITALVCGLLLAACGNPAPAETSIVPTAAVPLPTMTTLPTSAPTESSFEGTAVSFDQLSLVVPTGVAAGGSGTLVPEGKKDEVAPWDVGPEHIRINLDGYALQDKLHQPQIHIFPAELYAQLQEYGAAAQSLEKLRAVLTQSSMVNVKELPAVPFFNVPQSLAAQVRIIPFQGGKGVRMVAQYAMARTIINNHELIYHFEGLTDDGQNYVIAIFPVTAPGLPEDGQPGSPIPPGGVTVPDWNDMNANWLGYYGDARQMLQGLESGAYTPNLDQLDALIGSIRVGSK